MYSSGSSHTRPVPVYRDCQATQANAETKVTKLIPILDDLSEIILII